jgi:hypothetical protein
MMKKTLEKPMAEIEEDFQAWEEYKYKDFRWAFNKMEIALRQDLHAGPAGTAPQKEGSYISRPIYNLYGMGIGAKRFEYSHSMSDDLINNAIVPPGHFWCEWIEGEQLSIDYERAEKSWEVRSVWHGEHYSPEDLVKFKAWDRLDNRYVEHDKNVLLNSKTFDFVYDESIKKVNVEMRDDKIIEFHFRWGNDPFDDLPVGTLVIPVWNDEEAPEGEWRGNLHEDLELYGASGNLTNIRRGYVIRRPE